MREEYNNVVLNKNEEKNRFEIEIDGHYAYINYREFHDQMALVHTEADPELAGKGAAVAVVEKTLNYIEEQGMKVIPLCTYVFAYIKKHPEWKRVVSKKFEGYDKL